MLAGPSSAEQGGSGVRSHQAGLLAASVDRSCAVLDSGELRCWGGFGSPLGLVGVFTPRRERDARHGAARRPRPRPRRAVRRDGCRAHLRHPRRRRASAAGAAASRAGSGWETRRSSATTRRRARPRRSISARVAPPRRSLTASANNCAILDDGDVRCWGANDTGQLGLGTTVTVGDDETPGSMPPVDLGAGRTATAIAAGGFHTCAILDDGHVRCWGRNDQGQLGRGNTRTIGDDEAPSGAGGNVDLGAGRTAVAIAAGDAHSCALLDDGAVRCWGCQRLRSARPGQHPDGRRRRGAHRPSHPSISAPPPSPSRPTTVARAPCSRMPPSAAGGTTRPASSRSAAPPRRSATTSRRRRLAGWSSAGRCSR